MTGKRPWAIVHLGYLPGREKRMRGAAHLGVLAAAGVLVRVADTFAVREGEDGAGAGTGAGAAMAATEQSGHGHKSQRSVRCPEVSRRQAKAALGCGVWIYRPPLPMCAAHTVPKPMWLVAENLRVRVRSVRRFCFSLLSSLRVSQDRSCTSSAQTCSRPRQRIPR